MLSYRYFFICYQDDTCYGMNKTITLVENFSKISTTFENRVREKNCGSLPKCNGEPMVYHCLRFKDGIVEVCSPERVIKGMHEFCKEQLKLIYIYKLCI